MAIGYYKEQKIFKLDTENTTYMIGLTPEGYVGHVYYGRYVESADAAYLLRTGEHPYTLDLCQYFGQKKSKDYAAFFSSSSSFCCGVK